MDLTQNKLTKSEWTGIELPVQDTEIPILALIKAGYADTELRHNINQSMTMLIKLTNNEEIEIYLYNLYFKDEIAKFVNKYAKTIEPIQKAILVSAAKMKKQPNSKDSIRLKNMEETINTKRPTIVEFILIELFGKILASLHIKSTEYSIHLYSLKHILKSSIQQINPFVRHFANELIKWVVDSIPHLIVDMVYNSHHIIEKNPLLLKYGDITLFDHQKQLFQIFGADSNRKIPKLVLYIAPTGTGKTLSPLGLSEMHRVIFVCTARHVGLALARSAISMEKKVAFAFGCDTASDIRLHYFAAIDYTRDWKSGAIRKVDNSNGKKVEIIICDIKSYIVAMHYMLAFNDEPDIITFWDEPTITMDEETNELHETIHSNWTQNAISKMVLSCATLPNASEIQTTITDFKCRFRRAKVHTISTFDCKKSITLLNNKGFSVLPHTLFDNYAEVQVCAEHCTQNKSLLRYLGLNEIIQFIQIINKQGLLDESITIQAYFDTIDSITMNNIKLYYLELLKRLTPEMWATVYTQIQLTQKPLFMKPTAASVKPASAASAATQVVNPFSGILITTEDAHTLTDGPAIYLAENIENIGQFYIMQSRIPPIVFTRVMEKIEYNNKIQRKMDIIERKLEEENEVKSNETTDPGFKGNTKTKAPVKTTITKETIKLNEQLNQLRNEICIANIDANYIPNTQEHQMIWTGKITNNAFKPDIDDESIRKIMALDVPTPQKLLLLLGIGMFVNNPNIRYMEIMKDLAINQKLFLIIAASNYIYGTNYQFCHGFIGKDIVNMTQQKTIQALGRIGRGNIQQTYTVRFRDDAIIRKLFLPSIVNMEGQKMSQLLSGASDGLEQDQDEEDEDEEKYKEEEEEPTQVIQQPGVITQMHTIFEWTEEDED